MQVHLTVNIRDDMCNLNLRIKSKIDLCSYYIVIVICSYSAR